MNRPLVIIPCFNEADILPWVLRHFVEQGCDVHVIDNWSTDGSYEVAQAMATSTERWPLDGPNDVFDLDGILARIANVAFGFPGRWILYSDADEIHRATPTGADFGNSALTLGAALAEVDADPAHPNAVASICVEYKPHDDKYEGPPERYFKQYASDGKAAHIRIWKQGEKVDFGVAGGHEVTFGGRRLAKEPFVLKHYPIRSQAQGDRKVFKERKARYRAVEVARGWHVQYATLKEGHRFVAAEVAAPPPAVVVPVAAVLATVQPVIAPAPVYNCRLHHGRPCACQPDSAWRTQPPAVVAPPSASLPRVVVCLTTIPARNGTLGPTLRSLVSQSRPPDEIRVYMTPGCKIATFTSSVPITHIAVLDRGPVTKLIGVVDVDVPDDAILVTVDDDITYNAAWLSVLLHYAALHPNDAVAMAGWNASVLLTTGKFERAAGPCDVIEGFSGVAYRKRFFKPDVLSPPESVRFVDDVWISSYLRKAGIVRRVVPSAEGMIDISRSVPSGIHTRPDFDDLNKKAAAVFLEPLR